MVVLHPRGGLQRAAGQIARNEQQAGTFTEERLQLGMLGGKCESVDQRVEFCNDAWRIEGGRECSRRASNFAYEKDYSP